MQRFGMVFDKDGKPKVDDPSTLHAMQIALISLEHRAELGIWEGPMAVDAQGSQKRLERLGPRKYKALDKLVACSAIFDLEFDNEQPGDRFIQLPQRFDVAQGDTFTI